MKRHFWSSSIVLSLLLLAWQVGKSQEQPRRFETSFPDPPVDSQWLTQIRRELAQRKPELRTLALEKRSAARQAFAARVDEFVAGKTTIADFMLEAALRLREAELAVCTTPAERIEVLDRCWSWAKFAESINKAKFDSGSVGPAQYYPVLYARLQLEYDLVKARSE
jgi:hypothetical protein